MAVSEPVEPYGPDSPEPDRLAWSDAPPTDQLSAWAELGNSRALADFTEALGRRRDELWARAEELATRESELGLGSPRPAIEGSVALSAVRACIRSLVVETGDDVASVASTLDLDPEWARSVLIGEVTELDPEHMHRMCAVLESTPEELFVVTDLSAYSPAMLDASPAPVPDSTAPKATPAVDHLVDAASTVHPCELRDCVASLTRQERIQLVDALHGRHRALCRWSADLARHEHRLPSTQPAPSAYEGLRLGADMRLPAAPAAEQIALLVAVTGDDLDTVARGLGMDAGWLGRVVRGEIRWLDASQAQELCEALEMSPSEMFGPAADELVSGSAPESGVPARIKFLVGELTDELEIQAAEQGLAGRARDDWVQRRLEDLVDPRTPLPQDASPAVVLAADYRRVVEELDRRGPQPADVPDEPGLDLGL